jgi:hypothetical protein
MAARRLTLERVGDMLSGMRRSDPKADLHRYGNDNMASGDRAWWESYRSRLERVARGASDD